MTRERWYGGALALAGALAIPLLLALMLAAVVSARPYREPAEGQVVRAGTPLDVVLQISLGTDASDEGDRFSARISAPIYVDGKVAVPEGAFLHGHVLLSDPVSRDGGRGRLQLAYDQIEFGGHAYRLASRSSVYTGASARGAFLDAGSNLRFTLDRDVSVRPERST
jgi:acetyltransferase-like isoleucine patch superfamily enzyme